VSESEESSEGGRAFGWRKLAGTQMGVMGGTGGTSPVRLAVAVVGASISPVAMGSGSMDGTGTREAKIGWSGMSAGLV
jgi:hypothetical protein